MNKAERQTKDILKKMEEGKSVPLLKIIRAKCLDCTAWQVNEVKLCPLKTCVLWNFRLGKNPFYKKRKLTSNQKKRLAEQLKRGRSNR